MKKFFGLLFAFSLFLSVPGCGGSGENTTVMEGAEQSAVEAYEASLAEEEGAMEADFQEDEDAE